MLKMIDIFGTQNIMRINKSKFFKSKIGGILTVIFLMLVVLAFVAFGRDIFEKKQPSIISRAEFVEMPIFEWKDDFFMFNLQLADGSPLLRNSTNRMFDIQVKYNDNNASLVDVGKQYISTPYSLVECTKEIVPPEFIERLAGPLESYFCFPETYRKRPLNYTFGDGNSKVGQLDVRMCKNSTENGNICMQKEEIYNIVGIFNMHVIASTSSSDGFNYTDTKKSGIYSNFIKSNRNTWSRFVFWFKQTEFNTDYGWILPEWRQENYFSINHIETVYLPTLDTEIFFSHIFTAYTYRDQYFRSYIKIQGVLAFIGGFITTLKILGQVLNDYTNKSFYLFEVFQAMKSKERAVDQKAFSSNIIDFTGINLRNNNDLESKLPLDSKLGTESRVNRNNYIGENSASKTNSQKYDKSLNLTNILQNARKRKNTIATPFSKQKEFLKLSFFTSLFRVCLRKNEGVIAFYRIDERFDKYFSVEYFLKMKHNLRTLKYLTLKDHQLGLLKYVNTDFKDDSHQKLSFQEHFEHLIASLEEKNNVTDEKLMKILKQ